MAESLPSPSEDKNELTKNIRELSEKLGEIEKRTNEQYSELSGLVNTLESKKILNRANEIISRQEVLQSNQEKVNEAVEEIIDFAHLEINSPSGIIPDQARIVRHVELDEGRYTKSFHQGLVWFLKLIVSIIWAIFGLYLWIGLLLRTVLSYSAQISASVFSNRNTAKAQQRLYWVAGQYFRGFLKAFPNSSQPPIAEPGVDEEELLHSLQTLFVEFLKSTVTYFFLFIAPNLIREYFSKH